MSKQQYRLEENNQTNELILWEDVKILNVFKSSYDNRKHLNIIVDKLNELSEEIMSLRWENTKLKLVLKDIVEDLETEAERKVPIIIQKEYVDWVKSNVNLRLNISKLNRPGDKDA